MSTVGDWWGVCAIINNMFSTDGPEISAGSIAASETDGAAKSHKPGTVGRETDL